MNGITEGEDESSFVHPDNFEEIQKKKSLNQKTAIFRFKDFGLFI